MRREGDLGPGGAAFVVVVLATVVFDGFRATEPYTDVTSWTLEASPWLTGHSTLLRTMVLAAVVAGFVALYLLAVAAVSGSERGGILAAAGRYARR